MPKQLNVFVENKPGRLKSISEIFFNKGINVRAFTVQDRGDFGLMRFLVDKPDLAQIELSNKGFACALKNIMAVTIKDKPGNLYKLAQILSTHNINVVDTYGFVLEPAKCGICCFEVENTGGIKELLEKEGFNVLEDNQLYEL